MAAHLSQSAIGGAEDGLNPLTLGVERRPPGVGGEVLGQRLGEVGLKFVARLGPPPHRAAIGHEQHRAHHVIAEGLGIPIGVVRRRAARPVRQLPVAHERDRIVVRTERGAGQCEPPAGGGEALGDRFAPGTGVTGVMDLVEDDQGVGVLGDRAIVEMSRRDPGIGDGGADILLGAAAPRPTEAGVDGDARPVRRIGPLNLQVLGRRDDRDLVDDARVEQFPSDAQREGGLSGAGRGDGEEVPWAFPEVLLERRGLPRAEAGRGSPWRSTGEGGGKVKEVLAHALASHNPALALPDPEVASLDPALASLDLRARRRWRRSGEQGMARRL
ncbi:hypothetical protein BN13_70016 [Nostocoides jenkinsii Ben 74]|uniref:Uncharacterized protein n=1 Tax=Nostocoides jenkinsii Ben 74 TaxID=1193518 RepID=A0A077MGC5_9MICO|nr:hypothetical protein BN13_70016 [Tetrasphaera jenkinsii Ben 74]